MLLCRPFIDRLSYASDPLTKDFVFAHIRVTAICKSCFMEDHERGFITDCYAGEVMPADFDNLEI